MRYKVDLEGRLRKRQRELLYAGHQKVNLCRLEPTSNHYTDEGNKPSAFCHITVAVAEYLKLLPFENLERFPYYIYQI